MVDLTRDLFFNGVPLAGVNLFNDDTSFTPPPPAQLYKTFVGLNASGNLTTVIGADGKAIVGNQ